MADKDQLQKDEENVNPNAEPDVTELDDKALEEASGGGFEEQGQTIADGNNNCIC